MIVYMENLDNRITPSDDDNSLDNLGKIKKDFIPIDEAPNVEESSYGLPPDEAFMLKEREENEEKLEREKIERERKEMLGDEDSDSVIEPSQAGGGIGVKARKWLDKFKL